MSDTTEVQPSLDVPSGRFVLRIAPSLHARLKQAALDAGTSLNEYCTRKLASPTSDLPAPAVEAVVKAEAVVGDALVGVVVFGSWARGELAQSSDVDLLLIVEDDLEIVRWMYREWDENPFFWAGHRVEPHFVHLPRPDAAMSGLWAEVATDGVVLFERRLAVSSRLVWLRQQIVAGRMARRQIHGQSYWVEVARDA